MSGYTNETVRMDELAKVLLNPATNPCPWLTIVADR